MFDIEKTRIFECITGSRLYGTSNPNSDYDYRGVCVPPLDVLLDPFIGFDQKDSGFDEKDRVLYSLGRFMKLCADCNPNIVELLFVPEKNVLFSTDNWDYIVMHRNHFLSTRAKFTFSGYAVSQLNSIKTHREYFVNPPKEKPTRKMFGLTDSPIVSENNLINALSVPHTLYKDEYHEELIREREYRDAKKKWDNYAAWYKGRNAQRKELEEKWGYDTKHASHLFRLITEAKELLLTGNITFPLPNAEEILAIRNGKYSYDEILSMAESLNSDFDEWEKNSVLSKKPNMKILKEIYFEVVYENL